MALDAAKLAQNEELAEAKIDSQEDIAQLRANVNLSKQNDKRNPIVTGKHIQSKRQGVSTRGEKENGFARREGDR